MFTTARVYLQYFYSALITGGGAVVNILPLHAMQDDNDEYGKKKPEKNRASPQTPPPTASSVRGI
jgi:hypothetical protein